jgi:squalene-hopene/tetraprenyl-beta-curcumene cyclase
MHLRQWARIAAALVLGRGIAWFCLEASRADGKPGADPKEWNRIVDKAIAYLRTTQAANGSWTQERSPGVTGVVITGLLETSKLNQDDPLIANGLKYIESLVNPTAHHIAGAQPGVQLQNYVTSVNVMALSAANRANRYQKVIGDAAEFLKHLQWDEEEGKGPEDDFYGGAGYDSQSRPDLSNTQFFLDALKAANIPPDDPAYKKALVFVSRCQNLKGEHNDQPWAGKINDGSFIYSAAGGGQTKADKTSDGGLVGYGSMTYAGIKSMIYCGVSKDDPRVKKAVEWISKHYTLDENPGMPKIHSQWGLYYYYHTMAKALAVAGTDELVDAQGVHHYWRAELTDALARQQRPDGSWVNPPDHWFEGDNNLVTGYALMALAYCK